MKEKNKGYEECPICHDSGKVKMVKTIAHMGIYYLGKEIYDPCEYCNPKEINTDLNVDRKTLH